MPPHQRRVPAEPDGGVVGSQQPLERPLQPSLGLQPLVPGVGKAGVFQVVLERVQVALRHLQPPDGQLPYLPGCGFPLRPVVQAPAVRPYTVAGGLPGEGLAQQGPLPELLPGRRYDGHLRRAAPSLQDFIDCLLRPLGRGLVRGYGGEVYVGAGAVASVGPGTEEYDLWRPYPLLDFPGYGQALGIGGVMQRAYVGSFGEEISLLGRVGNVLSDVRRSFDRLRMGLCAGRAVRSVFRARATQDGGSGWLAGAGPE